MDYYESEELDVAWRNAFLDGRYDYGSPGHRRWRLLVLDAHGLAGCAICGAPFVGPRGGKLRRRHAHHVHGRARSGAGTVLCATCHEIVTLLTRGSRRLWSDDDAWDRLLDAVELYLHPLPERG